MKGTIHNTFRTNKMLIFIALMFISVLCCVTTGAKADDSDFEIDENGVLTKYKGSGGDVVIPKGVTSIGWNAFWEHGLGVTSVVIPEGVVSIEEDAFIMCQNIESFALPNSLVRIEEGAFSRCESLKQITIPEGVKTIGKDAFFGCYELESIQLPSSLTYIGEMAFALCYRLTIFDLPESVSFCGKDAFEYALVYATKDQKERLGLSNAGTYITDAQDWMFSYSVLSESEKTCEITGILQAVDKVCVIPSEIDGYVVKRLGQNCFRYGSTVASFVWPDSLSEMGLYAFGGTRITYVKVPEGVTKMDGDTFYECRFLKEAILPSSLKEIGGSDFYECMDLTYVSFPDNLESLGWGTFWGAKSLEKVDLPKNLKVIGDYCFYYCPKLKSITIPKSVNEIGIGNFDPDWNVIYGVAGSYAEEFANERINFRFVEIKEYNEPELLGHSVDLTDIINLKFYFSIENELINNNSIYANIHFSDGRSERQYITEDVSTVLESGEKGYFVECKLPPKDVSEIVSVQIMNDTNGEACTKVFEYSVEQYCERLLEKDSCTEAQSNLVKSMLTYAVTSDCYFNSNTAQSQPDFGEHRISTKEEVALELGDWNGFELKGVLPDGIKFFGCSLVLDSSIEYRIYFQADSFELASRYGMIQGERQGVYFFRNEAISIKNLGQNKVYQVGAAVITSNPLYFVQKVVRGEYSDKLTKLTLALYDYYKEAVEYDEQ